MITRRNFCRGLLTTGLIGPPVVWSALSSLEAKRRKMIARAAEWVWSQQGDDGGWHSRTYGLLKIGQAYTPFLLRVLLEIPEEIVSRPHHRIEQARKFLLSHLNTEGALGLSDPDVTEYPTYATADALHCLCLLGREEDAVVRRQMQTWLAKGQYSEANGFQPTDLAYGGWGFGAPLVPGNPGHMDLAHTRRALGALRSSGYEDSNLDKRTERFLRVVQKDADTISLQPSQTPFAQNEILPVPFDGGFYFSPVVLQANKGREVTDGLRPYFRSYASATCDGVLALLDAGVPQSDKRVSSALEWLSDHPRLDYPEGVPTDHPEPWGEAIHFYHMAVRSEVGSRCNLPGNWHDDITQILLKKQQEDGSFINQESHLMKEDDPLLATGLALQALTAPLKTR